MDRSEVTERPARVAIATGILGTATETGVRRHVGELFGGHSVVLTERIEAGHDPLRPTFDASAAGRGPLGLLQREIGKPVQSWRYGSSGVPFGPVRRQMEAFLRAEGVTAIVAEFGHLGANLAPVGAGLGIPVFVYFRGFDASKRLREPRIVRRYLEAMPRLAGVVSVSQSLLDNLAAHGISHPNSHVIPTGVDTDLFAPGVRDPRLILSVGRIMDKKAPLVAIGAFAAIAAEFPEHRFEIIGDGPLRAASEARAAELGLGERVRFLGRLPHEAVRDHLARASVYLQHSVTAPDGNEEGLPTSIQEAMASGAVVVSTRHAGIPEAVEEGVTGLLVDEHDGPGFVTALRAVVADPVRAATMAETARERAVRDYDYRKLHARLEQIIAAECTARGLPVPGR
jgi:glycosyltransferase involved in cell wall biosynthesis